jgi:hypothetical protein
MSSTSLLSSFVAPSVLAVLVVLYFISLLVYRWCLHPLAGIPGPKIAAATGLVEMWYDIVKGGQYVFQLERWHAEYGKFIKLNCSHDPSRSPTESEEDIDGKEVIATSSSLVKI